MNRDPFKITEDIAFEFGNGQNLLSGSVGTWFEAPENIIFEDSVKKEKALFVRTQSCGKGWYQIHPKVS